MAYPNNATQMVYDLICDKIKSREWMPNDKIWTEQELSQALNVSRVAVRQAVDRLFEISVLKRGQGSGTYVAVSYTHLDVYKRQPPTRFIKWSPWVNRSFPSGDSLNSTSPHVSKSNFFNNSRCV